MGHLIHAEQTGFIKGCQGSENIRTLFHILELSKNVSEPRVVIAMDAEKALDCIEWDFIFKTLHAMNFGDVFFFFFKMD